MFFFKRPIFGKCIKYVSVALRSFNAVHKYQILWQSFWKLVHNLIDRRRIRISHFHYVDFPFWSPNLKFKFWNCWKLISFACFFWSGKKCREALPDLGRARTGWGKVPKILILRGFAILVSKISRSTREIDQIHRFCFISGTSYQWVLSSDVVSTQRKLGTAVAKRTLLTWISCILVFLTKNLHIIGDEWFDSCYHINHKTGSDTTHKSKPLELRIDFNHGSKWLGCIWNLSRWKICIESHRIL